MELTRPVASAELVKEALALPAFADRVVAGLVTDKKKFRFDSPIALADDDVTLADWPPLIEAALTLARTDAKQAVTVVDLKKKVFPTVADAFMTALDRRLRSNLLPPKVGALLQKKDSYILFFLSDVLGSRLPRAQQFSPEATPADRRTAPSLSFETEFTRMFDDAFDRLERQRGHNFVSLVDLRRAVPVDRQTFDAGLQSMRRAGRYSLSAAEGRDGVTPEEQAAGIRDDGSLLLYVSRRLP
jgi:hypothetical protein